jgi:hypothetical protein
MDKTKDAIAAQAKREAASLLGVDADNLSPADTLRCDLISTLRLVIDDAGATVLNGSSTDLGRLITATESLIALLPNRELPKPAPRADDPNDPRKHMWAVYSEMRRRGALAGEGLDGKVRRIAELEARVAELEAALAGRAPGESTATPLPDNVVKLPPSAPSKPAPPPRATGLLTDAVDEPWRPFVSGGSRRDPWADNRS